MVSQTLQGADNYVGERPLEQWEEQAWESLNFEEAPSGYVKYNVPIKRTNDLLCLVFSCFTDPRSPASTDALLSLRVRRFSIPTSAADVRAGRRPGHTFLDGRIPLPSGTQRAQ